MRNLRALPESAAEQAGVFTTTQAMAAGWTESGLRNACRRGHLIRLRRSVYTQPVDPELPDHATIMATRRAIAAAVTHPGVLVSHLGAASLCEFPVTVRRPMPCVTTPARGLRDRGPVHVHRAALPISHRAHRGAIPMTSPARTIVDCAREFGGGVACVMADAGLRSGLLTAERLDTAINDCSGWPFVRHAQGLAEFADGRSESALESASRWEMRVHLIPTPKLQQSIADEGGRFLGRVDFYWDEYGVVGEADGAGKYRTRADLLREKHREERLGDAGLVTVRWGWPGVYAFESTQARLRRAFMRGVPKDQPRRWRLV